MEELKIITKSKEITIEALKDYYNMNEEELIELLTQFLEKEMAEYQFSEHQAYPKYLFTTLNKIQDLYDVLYENEKTIAPYYSKYRELLEQAWKIGKYYEESEVESLTETEEIYLAIFFYQDMQMSLEKIQQHPLFLLGKVQDKLLIHHMIEAYFSSFTREENEMYDYTFHLLKSLLKLSSRFPDIQEEVYSYFEQSISRIANLDIDKNHIYRVRSMMNLMTSIRHGEFTEKNQVRFHVKPQFQDFEDQYIFTIDGEETKLKEDALSIKNIGDSIYVTSYITNVNKILEDHPELEAMVSTKWFSGKIDKQLFSSSQNYEYFSLEEGKTRDVVAYQFRFDKNYRLTDITFGMLPVEINKNYTYEEFDAYLNGNQNNIEFNELYSLAMTLESAQIRKRQYQLLKNYWRYLTTNGTYTSEESKGSGKIVSEFKTLTNALQADFFAMNRIPMMYRVNDMTLSNQDMAALLHVETIDESLMERLEQLQINSYYRVKNTGHKGLGYENYSHSTTPARNYFSLMNQRILTDIGMKKQFEKTNEYESLLTEMEKLQIQKELENRGKETAKKKKLIHKINGVSYESEIQEVEMLLDKFSSLTEEELQEKVSFTPATLNRVLQYLEEELHIEEINGSFHKLISEHKKAGIFQVSKNSNGFVMLEDGNKVLVPSRYIKNVPSGSKVLAKIHMDKKQPIAEIVKKKKQKEREIGTIIKDDYRYYVVIDKLEYPEPILLNFVGGAEEHDRVVVEFESEHKIKNAQVVKVFGNEKDPKAAVSSILDEFHIYESYPSQVHEELEEIPTTVSEEEYIGREDFRDKTVVTIDGDDAKDFDDAVSIERLPNGNYLLGVYIADVSHYVKEGSALDREARRRGTSVYVVDRVAPMLPPKLSNGICSLNPGEDRLVLACLMEVTPNGKVVSHAIKKGVICSKKRMTYQAVNEVLEGHMVPGYETHSPFLHQMLKLSKSIREQKKQRGAITFESQKCKFHLDDTGKAIGVEPIVRKEAEHIIEDFMILYNECVAEEMEKIGHPFQYRVHEPAASYRVQQALDLVNKMGYDFSVDPEQPIYPSQMEAILDQVREDDNYPIIENLLLRAMPKAYYSPTNLHHFGLASETYSHLTSPIRRYPDLMAHRAIKKELDNTFDTTEQFPLMNKYSEDLMHCSKCEVNAEMCERAVDNLKAAEYFEQYIGEVFDVKVVSMDTSGIVIALDNGIQGFVPKRELPDYEFSKDEYLYRHKKTKEEIRLGQNITCTLKDTSKLKRTLQFTPIEHVKVKKI